MVAPTLTVDGKVVDAISDVKPTILEFPDTDKLPSLKQRVLPIRPLGDHVPPKAPRLPLEVPPDRGLAADPDLPKLLGAPGVKREDLTPSIGTLLTGLQLSKLTDEQKDELALLVSYRGVIFFRDQDITAEGQRELFNYYGIPEEFNPEDEHNRQTWALEIEEQEQDFRAAYVHFRWPFADFHADSSFQANPPSFSMLRIHTLPPTGGDTSWISGYGTYETLSKPFRDFVDGLKVWHSSELSYTSVVNFWGAKPRERPVESLHPLVTTHPVTGYKVLNLNSGFVTRIDGLNRYESDKLLELLFTHIHTAQDNQVKFKWEHNSVALWDNRTATHRATHDYAPLLRTGTRVTIKGEIPRQVSGSRSRKEVEIEALKAGKIKAVHSENLREGNWKERGFPKGEDNEKTPGTFDKVNGKSF